MFDILTRQICFDPAEVIAMEITLNKEGESQAPHEPPLYGLYVYIRPNVKILVCEALCCHVLDLHAHLASLIARNNDKSFFRVCCSRDNKGSRQTPVVGCVPSKSSKTRFCTK